MPTATYGEEPTGLHRRLSRMRAKREAANQRGVAARIAALVLSLAGVVTFGSIVAGVGEWVEGRDLSVVLPWALPALLASALAATAAVVCITRRTTMGLAILGAAVVALALVALVLLNPSISHPVF